MKRAKSKSTTAACGRSPHPVVGQFISSEYLGNFYVNSHGGEVLAMCSRRKVAQAIADAMNRSKGRTAKLMRQGWSVGRDEMLYPPNPGLQGTAHLVDRTLQGVVLPPDSENQSERK